jgi:molecular chaperone GrpE (heat shock protein)
MSDLRDERTWAILADFRQWLEELPEETLTETEEKSPDIDLRDLFAEFTALRQEVRLQNREQARSVRQLEKTAETHEQLGKRLQRWDEELNAFEERVRRATERQALHPFLEVRDALIRGRDAAAGLDTRRTLFRRPLPGVRRVLEGYEMALRRFDRALEHFGVQVVPTVGHPFDARFMEAVGTRQLDQLDDGLVVEELRGGFARGDEVLRPAEVIVNRLRHPD